MRRFIESEIKKYLLFEIKVNVPPLLSNNCAFVIPSVAYKPSCHRDVDFRVLFFFSQSC